MVFNGRATSDTGVFEGIAEDVSAIISMISPHETPVLDRLVQAPKEATNVLHEWLEDELNPNTIVSSDTAGSVVTTVTVAALDGTAVTAFLQVGAILSSNATGEYLQISAITGNILTLTRGFGGTLAATIDAGANLFVISDAALEGADVTGDISRPRGRQTNFTQIFKKDIIISGTVEAQEHLGGVTNEMDYQRTQRLRESLRDLEKAMIRGKTSLNTIGSTTAFRTMDGVLARLVTNVTTLGSVGALTSSRLDDIIEGAWDQGGTDLDLIVADSKFKKQIGTFNATRIDVVNRDGRHFNNVNVFEGTFGEHEVILGRWMPKNSLMVISTQRVNVPPLRGRSYRFVPVSRTGDAEKGMIIGEYTVEVHNEEGMAQAFV